MADKVSNNGALGVVRVKPLGIGASDKNVATLGIGASDRKQALLKSVSFDVERGEISVDGRLFKYPSHVISPDSDNLELYEAFMP